MRLYDWNRWIGGLGLVLLCVGLLAASHAETRLLRQPTLSAEHIVFSHGGDLWIVDRSGGDARRLTSTPAFESDPHFSPDGKMIAFTSDRSGVAQVYTLPIEGGTPKRLTWYPAATYSRGFTPDGSRVLYASVRETAPVGHDRLWHVSIDGGPSERLPMPMAHRGSFSPDGSWLAVERVRRWDREWRQYRGGQNTPLTLVEMNSWKEVRLPNERTTDIMPVWLGGKVYFLSDRDWAMNIYAFDPKNQSLEQITDFEDDDVKWLDGHGQTLVYERMGYLHTFDLSVSKSQKISINVVGDFPWAEPRWEDLGSRVRWSELSPTGKRAVFESRGEIFTVPVEKGSPRNLTKSSGVADRVPIWSPKGGDIAWFSDDGSGYVLKITSQDGLGETRTLPIGESKMAWEASWSPDGSRIAFVDDDVRIRVLEVESGKIMTADVGGVNIERGRMGLVWSPDSKWLAYAKSFPNYLRRIVVWSLASGEAKPLTDMMADSTSPSWSRDGKHLYFLASTNVALGSGWANTSTMDADPTYGVYAALLDGKAETPLAPESDEETVKKEDDSEDGNDDGQQAENAKKKKGKKKDKESEGDKSGDGKKKKDKKKEVTVKIDWDRIERRIVSLPMPVSRYSFTLTGPDGAVFVGERIPDSRGVKVHKFDFEKREAKEFASGVRSMTVSADGKKVLLQQESSWKVVGSGGPVGPKSKPMRVSLRMKLDRPAEWRQIFDEAWRYQRDFFYDPDMHGRDWELVRERYRPLVEHVKHRADLNYVIDQVNGELSVGHSFVSGGDMPETDRPSVGLLGADFEAHEGKWKISRIYTFESWNPGMDAPLDRPGLKVEEGNYLVGVEGVELSADEDPYRLLDGTAGRQTTLHINSKPSMDGAWTVIVEPVRRENGLRQRAWVEDNRRRVDELSDGKLAYIWVPNTGQPGVISFNRYYFSQQDKLGAVIDERFNGGGLLDDYMVDLMTRKLRAAITNEVPDGKPFRLPAGILGPKVLLINELAGSGGDFFPWVFRQQKAGPLIGMRTWGGLVKSSVHYLLVDGGRVTAPDNAVFDPINGEWVGENVGIPPDIEVWWDTASGAAGRDPQLEAGVREALRLLEAQPPVDVERPAYSKPAAK